jgi:pimeloyl-ACP methyl ester carboxylesterase
MYAIRQLRAEIEAFAAAALAAPLGGYLCGDTLELEGTSAPPVVLVHGLLGNRVHFRSLRKALERRGIGRFATFCYRPRVDYRTLSLELGAFIAEICDRIGTHSLDVVGHSLGGLVARYLVETGGGSRIRRLVTLGSPYYACRFPSRELSIFAAHDVLVPPPSEEPEGRWVVMPDCGHIGLLQCPGAHERIAAHLGAGSRPASLGLTRRGPRSSSVARQRREGSGRAARRGPSRLARARAASTS